MLLIVVYMCVLVGMLAQGLLLLFSCDSAFFGTGVL